MLSDDKLTKVIFGARAMVQPYGSFVEFLALTGQRRSEVAGMTWSELDLNQRLWTIPKERSKYGKAHLVHLSDPALTLLNQIGLREGLVFPSSGKQFDDFSRRKRELDKLCGVASWRLHDLRRTCVSGMARLKIPPHVADKVINHQTGAISGVAAVYQRHEFLSERKDALERWSEHIEALVEAARLLELRSLQAA